MNKPPRVLTIILAGGQGGRLGPLTEHRAKPVVPFLGTYRLIDFALSNCAHSGLTDVWIVEQYYPFELNQHLANGRPWDLDRLRGGLRILPPYEKREGKDTGGAGFAEGNADVLWRNREFIAHFAPDLLLVLSADHIYRFDFRNLIASHQRQKSSTLTLVATPVPDGDNATRFGNVRFDHTGRVTDFIYKPETPTSEWVTAEIFLYDAPRLLETLEALADQHGGENLGDFGDLLLPRLLEDGNVYTHEHRAYWRDVGTIDAYFAAHQQFLSTRPPLVLDDPTWPVLTWDTPRAPARIAASADVSDSLVGPGCHIEGTVRRSVLGPGVTVDAGATVEDAILYHDAHVENGATVSRAIVETGVLIPAGQTIGDDANEITVFTG